MHQILLLLLPLIAADQPRYTAVLADGTRVAGKEIGAWHDNNAQPQLENTQLFNPANPVRWIRDNSLAAPPIPDAFVELFLGDRLPGRVVAFNDGSSMFDVEPPHLVVEPAAAFELPGETRRPGLRVATRWLRRVVWKRRASSTYQPGTVFYRDGRQVKFRSVRWRQGTVRLLLEEGASEVPWALIAELHMPQADPWNAYYEQLAALAPDGSGRLLRLETVDGLKLTASTQRFQARAHGSHDPEQWFHLVQPVWSLDPLWLRHRLIRDRSYWLPHEAPLSWLEVGQVVQRSMLGGGWSWQVNRNVHGGPLRSGGLDFGWGLGVQAYTRLEFPLPGCAQGFRARIGLDEAAGHGGCARASVLIDSSGLAETGPKDTAGPVTTGSSGDGQAQQGQQLFESSILVGSGQVVDTGEIPVVAAQDGKTRLVLTADPAHDERPAGADPFDIRDSLDWLEPVLRLDASQLNQQVFAHTRQLVPAWVGWNVQGEVLLNNYWDTADRAVPRYRLQVLPRERLLKLSKQLRVAPGQNWLSIAALRYPNQSTPARLQVEVDGRPAGTFDVPEGQPNMPPDPILVPLADYQGREIAVDILQLPTGEQAHIDWRGLSLVTAPPSPIQLLKQEANAAAAGGTAEVNNIAALPVQIRERPGLGQFRYLRFAWRKAKGRRAVFELGHDGRFGAEDPVDTDARRSFRYAAGNEQPGDVAARKLSDQLPQEWTVVTRDLYDDFGSFELTGLSFPSPDDQPAQIGDVHLGRTPKDFESLPKPQ